MRLLSAVVLLLCLTFRVDAQPALQVTSTAFAEGGPIPRQCTCDGGDHSPPLAWTAGPRNTRTYALICDDPDAPSGTWVHWVAYNMPATSRQLAEGVPSEPRLRGGGQQGMNDFKKIGYGGPCPPNGTHRYLFKVYALDTDLKLGANATKAQLLKAMEGHVLAQGQIVGKYSR